jgi:formylglycine-generating enzyme
MDVQALKAAYGRHGNADDFFQIAQGFEKQNQPHWAAIAYERAFGLAPERQDIAEARQKLLNQLAITEHGIHFRYIPAGTFLMGSDNGDPDERPVHPVYTEAFYLSDVPISWAAYCDLMDWHPAPDSYPKVEPPAKMAYFVLAQENKIRRQYCEDLTQQARFDWHAHAPELQYQQGDKIVSGQQIFGSVNRQDPNRPWKYDTKPMVAVSWQTAEDLAKKLSTKATKYRLPTEAEWEKAGRGGLIGMKYAWGDELPNEMNCDFGHFGQYFIQPSRKFPPNAYGLYAMTGGFGSGQVTGMMLRLIKIPIRLI